MSESFSSFVQFNGAAISFVPVVVFGTHADTTTIKMSAAVCVGRTTVRSPVVTVARAPDADSVGAGTTDPLFYCSPKMTYVEQFTDEAAVTRTRMNVDAATAGSLPRGYCFTYPVLGAIS